MSDCIILRHGSIKQPQYVYDRYSIISTNYYYWNRYAIASSYKEISYLSGTYELPGNARREWMTTNGVVINGKYWGNWYIAPTFGMSGSSLLINPQVDWNSSRGRWDIYPYLFTSDYTVQDIKNFNSNSKAVYYNASGGTIYRIQENQSMGGYLGSVNSTSRYVYPNNGISGSYWYRYSGNTMVNNRGGFIDQISINNGGAYPNNGPSGGYWYTLNYIIQSNNKIGLKRIMVG